MHSGRIIVISFIAMGVIFITMGCGTTSSSSITYVPTWIAASWSGGAAGPPNDRQDVEAEDWEGQICPASSLELDNFGGEFAGLHLINHCALTINYVACVSKGSLPQPEIGGLSECATDPFDTPVSQLTFKSLDPGELGDFINTTEILSLNIFYCSDSQTLCAPPICGSLECI